MVDDWKTYDKRKMKEIRLSSTKKKESDLVLRKQGFVYQRRAEALRGREWRTILGDRPLKIRP
jgi:hypothetical protein